MMRPLSARPPSWPAGTRVVFTKGNGRFVTGTFVRKFSPARNAGAHYEIDTDYEGRAEIFANSEVGRSVEPIRDPLAGIDPTIRASEYRGSVEPL